MKLLSSIFSGALRRRSMPYIVGGLAALLTPLTSQATPPFVSLSNLPSGSLQQYMVGSDVVFTTVARDVDGSGIVSYQWFVNGVLQTNETGPSFIYPAFNVGTPNISVIVTDGDGETGTANRSLNIADFGFVPSLVELTSPSGGTTFRIGETFTASGRVDSAGEALDGIILVENGSFLDSVTTVTDNTYSFNVEADELGKFDYLTLAHYARQITINPGGGADPFDVTYTMSNVSVPPTSIVVSDAALPVISLVSPSAGDTVSFGIETVVQASVSPLDPTSSLIVEFFVDGVSIGTARSVPYAIAWEPSTTGKVELTASVNEAGNVVTSAPVTVNVVVGSQLGVEILTPADFTEFDIGDDPITLTARASSTSSNATIEYFANGVSLGSATEAPFSVTWSPQTAGSFIITARVSDASSSRTLTSGGSLVQVFNTPEPRPTVAFASPLEGDTIPINILTTITASATSQSGTIQQVEFRINGESVEVDTVYPYNTSFNASPSDDILLQAIATDSFGNVAAQTITIAAAAIDERVRLIQPVSGLQFSVFEDVSFEAEVRATSKAVESVVFLSNGEAAVTREFPPFEETFSTTTPGDYVFSAQVTYSDGLTLTSPAVATQGVISPLSNFADFVVQAFLDFIGAQPNAQVLEEVLEDFENGETNKVAVIEEILLSSDGESGVSIVGTYQTLLRRFSDPAEYQTALLSLSGDSGGGGAGGAIPITIGDTVNGQFTNSTFDNLVTFVFTVTEAQTVTAFVTSPVFVNVRFQDAAGATIAISDNGFFALNPTLVATLPGAGTYFLILDGLTSSVGAFTLTLSGADSGGGGGVGGAFRLGPIIDGIFLSDEYLAKFGPVPNITTSGLVGLENRQQMVRQTYIGKYGGEPNDLQLVQGGLRIVTLGGVTEYVEVLVNEANFETGDALLVGAGTRRPYWTTALLTLGFFNEQPTLSTVAEFENLPLDDQIAAMLEDPRYTSRFPPPYSLLFAGDVNEQGWVDSAWMSLVNVLSAPWYYQVDLGWLFTSAAISDSVWFYSPELGWIWTNDNAYPFVYINDEAAWFYVLGSDDGFVFLYDVNTDSVVTRFVGQ